MKKYLMSVHNKSGDYVRACDGITDIIGYDKNSVIGKSAYEFFDPKFLPDIVTSHLSKSIVTIVRYRIRQISGNYTYVKTYSFKNVNDGGYDNGDIYCFTMEMGFLEIIKYRIGLIYKKFVARFKKP